MTNVAFYGITSRLMVFSDVCVQIKQVQSSLEVMLSLLQQQLQMIEWLYRVQLPQCFYAC